MTTDKQFKVGGKAVRTRDACIDATLGDVLDITSRNQHAIGGINQRTGTWQAWGVRQCEPAEQDQPLSARVAELEAELAKAKAELAAKDKPKLKPGPPKDGYVWVRKRISPYGHFVFWLDGGKSLVFAKTSCELSSRSVQWWFSEDDNSTHHRIPLAALCEAIGKLCEESDQ